MEYEFKDSWSGDKDNFVCRRCKIIEKTNTPEFKEAARLRSLKLFEDTNIKERLSQTAHLNNIRNSEKISESLKKHYEIDDNRKINSENIKTKWKDPKYRRKISESIKEKWKEPNYRGKMDAINDSKRRKSPFDKMIEKSGLNYEHNFYLGTCNFEYCIEGKYLLDSDMTEYKKEYVNHFFNGRYVIVTNIEDLISLIAEKQGPCHKQ